MPRKKKVRRPEPVYADYHVLITGWDWDYSFTCNVPKYEDQLYAEYRHLVILGTILRPRKLGAGFAELWFMPNLKRGEFAPVRDRPPPKSVGGLSMDGSKAEGWRLRGYLSMPEDAIGNVMQMLIAGRFKYLLMNGEAMRWRKCFIRRYNFTAHHDEADYPDDEV